MLVKKFEEDQLANFCRVLSITISELDPKDDPCTLAAQDKACRNRSETPISEVNQSKECVCMMKAVLCSLLGMIHLVNKTIVLFKTKTYLGEFKVFGYLWHLVSHPLPTTVELWTKIDIQFVISLDLSCSTGMITIQWSGILQFEMWPVMYGINTLHLLISSKAANDVVCLWSLLKMNVVNWVQQELYMPQGIANYIAFNGQLQSESFWIFLITYNTCNLLPWHRI